MSKSGNVNETLYKHYIGGIAVEVHKKDDPAFKQVSYLHKDHLGSVVTITDESGTAIERHAYDAWGQKRNLDWRKINGFSVNTVIAPEGEFETFKGDLNGDGKQDLLVRSAPTYVVIAGEVDVTIPVYKQALLYRGKGDGNFEEGIPWDTNQSVSHLVQLDSLPFSSAVTTRGFGGHEQLDRVGLIHMGGRVYDPVLARFMSADLFIQSTTNYQAFNRYSYTLNNPQSYTDPSGYIFKKIIGYATQSMLNRMTAGAYSLFKEKFDHKANQFADWARYSAAANPEAAAVVQVAGCAASTAAAGPYGCAAFQASYTYFLTKDFKQGVRAGAVAAATTFIWGQVHNGLDGTQANAVSNGGTGNAAWLDSAGYSATKVSMIKVGTHMAVGGTISAIQGNGFARGAAAAGVSKGYYEAGLSFADDNVIFHALEAGVIGGTTSHIMGGNFAQGAMLAAYARLFNDFLLITADGQLPSPIKWMLAFFADEGDMIPSGYETGLAIEYPGLDGEGGEWDIGIVSTVPVASGGATNRAKDMLSLRVGKLDVGATVSLLPGATLRDAAGMSYNVKVDAPLMTGSAGFALDKSTGNYKLTTARVGVGASFYGASASAAHTTIRSIRKGKME